MNLLYSILSGKPYAGGWFDKKTTSYLPTSRSKALRAIMIRGVQDAQLPMFASVVCDLVRMSTYGTEIIGLDANNTYQPAERPADAKHDDASYCFNKLVKPASELREIRIYLDDDIEDRLNPESWVELMGAGCLQLLREV